MNPEVKQMWLDALRSGEYKQGRGVLRTPDDEYCCLGVLCDLHSKVTREADWENDEGWNYIQFDEEAPFAVMEWAGLDAQDPKVLGNPISTYNDGWESRKIEPHSFEQIADLIEEAL